MAQPSVAQPALTLFSIEQQLQELLAFAETAETPEEKAAAQAEIDKYVAAQVRKVDGIAHAVRTCQAWAEKAAVEADRLQRLAKSWSARADQIKTSAIRAMEAHGVRVLETPTSRLRVCGNGGVQPMEVDESRVPEAFKDVTVRIDMAAFKWLLSLLSQYRDCLQTVKFETRLDDVRKALLAGHEVPGARLLERGKHLRVE